MIKLFKIFVILLIFIFNTNILAQSQTWTLKSSGTTNTLYSVYFTDFNNGIVVGGKDNVEGTILKTSDGGINWVKQTIGTEELKGVSFSSTNYGTAVGRGGTILRTIDGGANWTAQTSNTTQDLFSVSFKTDNIGTVVGANSIILRTIDGGTNWTTQTSPTVSYWYGVSFTDTNNGTAVGGWANGEIIRTTDGGTNWVAQTNPISNTLYSVSFTDSNNGTAVGDTGSIIRTTNGGTTWTSQTSNTTSYLFNTFFFDSNNGLSVGWGVPATINKTTDAGSNWVVQTSNTNSRLWGVFLTDANHGFAVGDSGTIMKLIDNITWNGSSSSDWNTPANWDTNTVPTSAENAIIPLAVTNAPIISTTAAVCNSLTIETGASLTISPGKNLTINGNLTNSGTFIIDSDATTSGSLIIEGSSTGNVIYNRYLSGFRGKWHLISAPISGQNIENLVTLAANKVGKNGVDYGLAPYDNTLTIGVSTWNHWTSDGTNPVSGAGNFIAGKGYEIFITATSAVAFTGTVPVAQVAIAVTGTSNRWNLVGNPYPSSIPANSFADATNNFLTVNSAALDPSFVALYIWNPDTSLYEVVNQGSASRHIAPVQGFFIKAVSGGAGIVNFTTAMRTNQAAVLFQKAATPNAPNIVLSADNNSGKIRTTTIKYMGGMSLGLDPGYDAGSFGASGSSSFGLFTHLVEDNGVDFALQVVPDNNFDTTIIPIGLDANAGTQVTFKANATDLPIGKKVFLEDRLLHVFTEINNSDKTYALTLNTQSSGIGRFFLHTQDNASTLAVADVNAIKFSVIALPKSHLIKVIGLVDIPASLNIYDTLGRFVFTTKLKATTSNEVAIPPLADGIYIVKINTATSNLSIKIAWY